MKTDKSQNIPDFQRDFTEILETVLSSQNFACHFDDNTEDILDSRLWENILDRKRSFENLLREESRMSSVLSSK
jgi:predicted AlkP superfamily phosphohydrolase/phosphomutase